MAVYKSATAIRDSIRKGLSAHGVTRVTVGFYKSAKYPDGTQVATVAAWNEFGAKGIPERPFFRTALRQVRADVRELLRTEVRPEENGGRRHHGKQARRARRQPHPADHRGGASSRRWQPATLAARRRPGFRGRSTPFLGTKPLNVEGILRTSVTYRVERT